MKVALALVCLSVALQGCMFINQTKALVGSGKMKTETRTVSEFTALKLDAPAEVSIVVGEGQSVELTADDNYLNSVITDVDGSTLKIRNKNGSYRNTTLRVAIKVASLKDVHVNGSGEVSIRRLKGDLFGAEISGSGEILAEGAVKSVSGKINGSGNIELAKVTAETGRASINGSGEIEIYSSKSAEAKINGSGTIRVAGGGAIESKINGSGEVVKA